MILGTSGSLGASLAHWFATGAVIPLAGLWGIAVGADFGLQRLLDRAINREWVHTPPMGTEVRLWLSRYAPSRLLGRRLPAVDQTMTHSHAFTERGWRAYLQFVALTLVGVLTEEFLFRGLPLVIALAMEVAPRWLVGFGTVLWALFHGKGRAIALLATTGWLAVALWVTGNAALAISFHLASNLLAGTIRWGLQDIL